MQDPTFLTGHLLIAMPTMRDPNFARTVTYVCEHTAEGALGIIINRPMDMDLGMIFQQLALTPTDPERASQPVLQGGPVSQERGFVLHAVDGSGDGGFDSTLAVTQEIRVTTSQDILAALAAGRGPRRALLALGYAGWGAGQLESEMSQNAWLTVPASPEILFDIPFERRWHAAARLLGIDLATLSSDAGHA
jgi:putative transcriptional regulator